MGITTTAPGGAGIWAFDFDGDQDWFGSDLNPTVFGKPTADTLGRILTSGGQSILATNANGTNAWQSQVPQGVSNLLPPVTDVNANVYTADTVGGERWSLNPDGSTRYFDSNGDGGFVNTISVTPDGSVLLLAGNELGQPGFVRAYDGRTGDSLWQVTLDPQGGSNEFVHSLLFSLSPNGSVAYFTTRVGVFNGNGRLYALRLHDGTAGDLDGDGSVGVPDLLLLLAVWGQCDDCEDCDADLDGDCTVGVADLLVLFGNWG